MALGHLNFRHLIRLVESPTPWAITRTAVFDDTLRDCLRVYPDLKERLLRFVELKSPNPMQTRYGKHDRPFMGPLAGFAHCHLREDAILVYTLRNRCINLIMMCSHAEIEGKRKKATIKKLSTYLEAVEEEALTEIANIPDSEFSERERQEKISALLGYRDWKRLGTGPDGIIYKWRDQGDNKDVLIVKDRVAIGFACLQHYQAPHYTGYFMTEVGLSKWEYEGQGYGKTLYDLLLDRGETLISGGQQTRNGKKMWLRLIAKPGIEVRAYSDIDGEEIHLKMIDPWAAPDTILVARKAHA